MRDALMISGNISKYVTGGIYGMYVSCKLKRMILHRWPTYTPHAGPLFLPRAKGPENDR